LARRARIDDTARVEEKRILVIDDDDDLRETIAAVLRGVGYQVDGFADGLQAVEHLKDPANTPQGLLIDLAMPVFDGFDFLSHRSMHRELSQIPAILMTGHSERTVASDLLLGRFAVEILRKPIEMDALLELVAKITGGPPSQEGAQSDPAPKPTVAKTPTRKPKPRGHRASN
jgi:two-component system response regulator FixJ